MKTKIITLESHDDLISVRDRLSWAKTPRILLVWPKYENVSLRFLDLKVLQRHANSLGAQLGLVTRRMNVRRDAEALGIPVFESSGAAQRNPWPDRVVKRRRVTRPPRRDLRALGAASKPVEAKWRSALALRAVAFAAGVLAVLTLASLFVPRAALTLYPESQVQQVVIPVIAGPDIPSVSITGNIPARALTVEVNAEQTVPVSDKISTPQGKAQGVARFTNLTQGEVIIPAGTVVYAAGDSPVRFVTLHATRLPAGLDEFVDMPIEAVLPGAEGNVEAGTIRGIEGVLGLSASVTNAEPTTGGSNLQAIGPSEAHRTRLRAAVVENLQRAAENQMRARIETDDWFLPDTLVVSQVLEESYDPPAGRAGETLTLRMHVEFSAQYISAQDLRQLALTTLNASMLSNYTASELPVLTPLANVVTDTEGATHFDLQATRTLLRKIDLAEVNNLVRGQRLEAARQALGANLSLRKPAEIELKPSWWPWMPLIPFRISVVME